MRIDTEAAYTAARELRQLLPVVAALVRQADAAATESETGTRRSAAGGLLPWNEPAAEVYFDIHAGLRHHETALGVLLFGKATYRPGTDEHTAEALSRLPVLIAHALDKSLDDDEAVQRAARDLTRWPRDARRVLDIPRADERPWTSAPGDLRCPHCESRLELAPGWDTHPASADVICRSCRDEQGRWYRWAPSLWTGIVLREDNEPVDVDGTPLVTARQAAQHLGRVEPATVRKWASRGLLRSVATSRTGARLYRLDEVRARVTSQSAPDHRH